MRYRPARVREAEEARKKGITGRLPTQSTTTAAAATATAAVDSNLDSSASPQSSASAVARPNLATSETQRTSWRSNASQWQAPVSRTPRKEASSAASETDKPKASSHAEGPWRNSRLRKPAPSDASKKPDHLTGTGQDVPVERDNVATVKSSAASDVRSAADELAQELDSLRIGKPAKPSQR